MILEPNNVYLLEQRIVNTYSLGGLTLRETARRCNTDHHKIKRTLKKYNIEIVKGKKIFSEEHCRKISESRKRLKLNGWVPYNTGLKTSDRRNGKELLLKNMKAHLRFDVSIDWLAQFDDFEKLKFLNRAISNRDERYAVSTDWYKDYILKFYSDSQFNQLYAKWIEKAKNKWLRPTIDHITPKSKGGDNDLNNLQFLSWLENMSKTNISSIEWDFIKRNISDYFIGVDICKERLK